MPAAKRRGNQANAGADERQRPATDPAQRGIFLVCRAHISPYDKTALFPTILDAETVQRFGLKAPPRLARQRADTPDESHMFSAQVRRGLNRAPRGNMEGMAAYTPCA